MSPEGELSGSLFSASRFPSRSPSLITGSMSSSSSSSFSSSSLSSFARSASSAFSAVPRVRAPLLRPRAVSPPPPPAPVVPRGPRAAAQQAKSRVRAYAIEEEHSFSDADNAGTEESAGSSDETEGFVRRGARRQRRAVPPPAVSAARKQHPCPYDDLPDDELMFLLDTIYNKTNLREPAASGSDESDDDDDDCVIVRTIPAYVEQEDDCVIVSVVLPPAAASVPSPSPSPSPALEEAGSEQLGLPLFLEPEPERVTLEQKQQPEPVIIADVVDAEDALALLSFAHESMMDWEVCNPIDIDHELAIYDFPYNPLSDAAAPCPPLFETVLYSHGGSPSSPSFGDSPLNDMWYRHTQIATVSE